MTQAPTQSANSSTWTEWAKAGTATSLTGAFLGVVLNGCVFKMDTATDIPIDTALNRDTVSLVQAGNTRYAALKTPEGVQVFQRYERGTMALIQNPDLAGNIAGEIARRLSGEGENTIPVRVFEAETGKISAPYLIDKDYAPRRNISLAADQADPAFALRIPESATFWSEVSASIASGQYAIPDKETLPMMDSFPETFMREVTNPKAAIIGALTVNFCILGGYFYVGRQEKAAKKAKREQNTGNTDPDNQTPESDAPTKNALPVTGSSSRTGAKTAPRRTSFASQEDPRRGSDNDDTTLIVTAVVAHNIASSHSNSNNNGGGHNQASQTENHTPTQETTSTFDSSPGGSD